MCKPASSKCETLTGVTTSAAAEIGQAPLLGRYPAFDPRSLNFPMREILGPLQTELWLKRVWTPGPILDQGQTGHCVSFGWTADFNATPAVYHDDSAWAEAFFAKVHAEDLAMGNNWSDGASVLAGARAANHAGIISGYRWGSTVADAIDCIVKKGPVIFGTNWYDGMFDPDEITGEIRDTGSYAGGHCYLGIGYWPAGRLAWSPNEGVIECQQSWGPDWGKGGHFFMRASMAARLLGQYGDLCIPTDVRPPV